MPQSAAMAKNREFEQWELQDAARLRALIKAHLEAHKITQLEFTALCGWSQGMIHQYTKPERAMGIEIAAKFANALGVNIDTISPTIADQIRELSSRINHGGSYTPKTREAELSARVIDSMEPKQRGKAVKIVNTIAEPEEINRNNAASSTQ